MKLPSSHPGSVHFDAIDCCALWHAFKHQPRLLGAWAEVFGRLAIFRDILARSESLSFVPNEDMVRMYHSLARAEVVRLSDVGAKGLTCRHTHIQHIDHLVAIQNRLSVPRTN